MKDKPSRSLERNLPSDPRKRYSAIMGVLFLVGACAALGTLAMVSYGLLLEPMLGSRQLAAALPTPTRIPTPIPRCLVTTLEIGDERVVVHFLEREADGSFQVPQGMPDVAFWLEGSTPHYIFALSPAPKNRALVDQVQPGQPAVIQWGDCSREEYVLRSVESVAPELDALFVQASSGFTLYLSQDSDRQGFTLSAGYPERAVEPTSEPVDGEVMANISILRDEVSPDGDRITMQIAIENVGASAITLTVDDLSISADEGQPLPPFSVQPGLPVGIEPGSEKELEIVFPHPGTSTVLIRILDFAFDYY
jgi:hypothetical protein